MAGKTKVHRKRPGMTIPLAVVAGFAVPVVGVTQLGGMSIGDKVTTVGRWFTGFDKAGFHPESLKNGLYPVLLGFLAHWAANKFGLNRQLAKMGVPLIRI